MSVSTLVPNETLTQRLFGRRELIPPLTNILWRIEQGVVRTYTWNEDTLNEEGRIITLGYWGPGDVVGHSLSKVLSYQVECVTKVEMSVIPTHLWAQALEAVVQHTQQLEQLLNILHIVPMQERLWHFLVWLGQKFGRDTEQGRLINLRLTHQQIAEAINTTRVTVLRLLKQLVSEGLLQQHKRQIILFQQ